MKYLLTAIGWFLMSLLMLFLFIYGIVTQNFAVLPLSGVTFGLDFYNAYQSFTRWKRNKKSDWKSPIEGG